MVVGRLLLNTGEQNIPVEEKSRSISHIIHTLVSWACITMSEKLITSLLGPLAHQTVLFIHHQTLLRPVAHQPVLFILHQTCVDYTAGLMK